MGIFIQCGVLVVDEEKSKLSLQHHTVNVNIYTLEFCLLDVLRRLKVVGLAPSGGLDMKFHKGQAIVE